MHKAQGRDAFPCRCYPEIERDTDIGWAHVSGWAQLNGTRRSLSCVVPARNALPALRDLLPVLSDTLTECGFPWEIIVVDCASGDGTEELISPWCELPGYRLLVLDESLDRASAVVLGLEAARGDAVMLLDAGCRRQLPMLNELVTRWDGGSSIVYTAPDSRSGDTVVHEATSLDQGAFGAADGQVAGAASLLLLDRAVVLDLLD